MLEVTSDYIKAIENHLRVFEANFDLNGKRYTKTKNCISYLRQFHR